MTELAVRNAADLAGASNPTEQYLNANTMRLVEWAEEARAANNLAKALVRTPFAGAWKGDEDGATAAILKGAEVGLTPVTALGAFDNIQGQPAPKAITLRALVQAHGHDLEIIEETAERAVARYRRHGRGEWRTTEFTIEDARGLQLLSKDNWRKQPRAMLVARVTSKAARMVASDVILGIGYSAEEVRDDGPWESTPVPPRAPQAGLAAALSEDQGESEEPPKLNTSSNLAKRMFALFGDVGITDKAERLAFVSDTVGREVATSKDMTEDDAVRVIDALRLMQDRQTGAQDEPHEEHAS